MPDHRDFRGRPIGRSNGDPTATPGIRRAPESHPPHPTRAQPPQRTRAQERIDELDVTKAKADEYLAGLQRERAEFTNFRRRTAEEREQMLGLAGEDLIRKVLAIADDFDLAIDNRPEDLGGNGWVEGVTAIDRKLRALLDSEGVRQIEAEPGTPFDPREHEAIANVAGSGHPEGSIVDVIRRGYKLRDRVIRPALVAVAADPAPTT